MNHPISTLAAVLIIACTAHAAAQEVPSTAHNTTAVAPPRPPQPPPRVDRHTITTKDSSGRTTTTWTVEHRPSADDYRRKVAESMARRETLHDDDATKTVTTRIPGQEATTRTVTPSEEAYGRLFDPLDQRSVDPLPIEASLDIWNTPDGRMPPLFDPAERVRLLEPWSAEHGFGEGRAD